MNKFRPFAGVAAATSIAFLAFAGLTGTRTEIWDGGYPHVAFEITFQDESGKPVEGISLSVERPRGVVRHYIPVDDFYPGHTPASDQNGLLQFHCCGHRFGGTCHTYFHIIKTGDCDAPENICRFEYEGKTIHSLRFNELAFEPYHGTTEKVTRSLSIPGPSQSLTGSIPTPDQLVTLQYDFHLVRRTVVLPR